MRTTRCRWVFLLLSGLLLAACTEALDPSTYPQADIQPPPPASSPQELSIAILATGLARSLDAFAVAGGDWLKTRIFSHAAILVRHPQGDILFDTGLGTEIDAQFEADMPAYMKPLMKYTGHRSAIRQLQDAGYDPADIGRVFVSHLHWDHASGIKDFPWAQIYLAKEELQAARNPANADVYLPSQVGGADIRWTHIEFVAEPYLGYSSSHDLYGDGSIVFVPMPGHSPGSIGMFVTLADGRRFLFPGDTAWAQEGFVWPAEKFLIASMMVDADREGTRAEVVKVHQLMQRFPGLIVVPAHDYRVQEHLGFFPKLIQVQVPTDRLH